MSQPHADPSPPADEDSLAGYQEDGFGDPEEPETQQDDDPTGPDDFTPPTGGKSGPEGR